MYSLHQMHKNKKKINKYLILLLQALDRYFVKIIRTTKHKKKKKRETKLNTKPTTTKKKKTIKQNKHKNKKYINKYIDTIVL